MNRLNVRFNCAAILVVLNFMALQCVGSQRLVPAGYESVEGPSAAFIFDNGANESVAVYSSNNFAGWENGVMIEAVTFRLDSDSLVRQYNQVNEIDVHMGYTSRDPGSFAPGPSIGEPSILYNLGARSDEVVFPRAELRTITSKTPGQVSPLNITIPFSKAFYYNPKQGNLYLALHNYEGLRLIVDGVEGPGQVTLIGGGGIFEGGYLQRHGGPVTLFTFTPVPEPGVLSLVFLSLFLGGLVTKHLKAK